MKIRIESEYFAATFQKIFNWNDIWIRTKKGNKPTNSYSNEELQNGFNLKLLEHILNISSYFTYNVLRSKCCFIFRKITKWNLFPNCSNCVLHKLSKLCFVIIFLLPFLLACNSQIQQASDQDIGAYTISNSNVQFHKQILSFTQAKKKKVCQNNWNSKQILNSKHKKNSNINKDTKNYSIYPSNQVLNEYSLIILSQSVNNISFKSGPNTLKTDPHIILHAPKSTVISNWSSIRTKRNIDLPHIHIKRKYDHQKLKEDSLEKNKANRYVYNRIIDKEKLTELVINGLGLKKLPDMKKANISQLEYSSKYLQYLERLRINRSGLIGKDNSFSTEPPPTTLQILSIVTNSFSDISNKRNRQRRAPSSKKSFKKGYDLHDKTNILLHFPLTLDDDFHYEKLDEANIRLMLLYNPALATQSPHRFIMGPNSRTNCGKDNAKVVTEHHNRRAKTQNLRILNLRVYQLLPNHKRKQLDARKIELESSSFGEETRSQWLEFDVTEAVHGWLNKSYENLGIEIQCDKCRRIGARILSEVSTPDKENKLEVDRFHLSPVLNIIGHIGRTHREKGEVQSFNHNSNYFHHRSNHDTDKAKKWPNSCYKAHQRCCRHKLDVAFKDIKGFEFIIQPKIFDAGYCRGRCPPRHNPAHHHALLQSLIWQQDHNRVPRPCCAPSKLAELEILHVDEEHSDKLKISTWSDMQVLECACS